jgi:hypothetical protein
MPIDCKKHNFKHAKKEYCPECIKAEHAANLDLDAVVERIEYLTKNPTKINQDWFGVCGMTSILYGLLLARPSRFENLCVAALTGTEFKLPNKELVPIDLANLLKYFKGGTGAKKDKYFVDYIASRALGQIMKTKNKALYTKQKKEFNKHFDETPVALDEDKFYKNFTKEGNLALQTEALVWMLKNVIGVNSCDSWEGMDAKTFPTFATKSATPKALNLAAICIDLIQPEKAAHTKASAGPSTKGSAYDHWIVIDQIEKKVDKKVEVYSIKYWTWAQDVETVIVPVEHAHTYIRDAVTAVITPG